MDFLSRLGAQAVGGATTVKPMIAPLFAPAPPAPDPDPVDPLEESEEVPASRLAGRRTDERPAEPVPLLEARDARTPYQEPAGPHAPPAGPRGAHDPLTAAARAEQPGDGIAASASRAASGVPSRPAREMASPIPPARTDHRGSGDPAAAPAPGSRTARELDAPRLLPDSPDGGIALLNRLRSIGVGVPAHHVARDPVVRVSIGRIEVRATAPAPAERHVAPAPPRASPATVQPARVTLAEYLARKREAR